MSVLALQNVSYRYEGAKRLVLKTSMWRLRTAKCIPL